MSILDADKEGFLRSERSLIQTIGRAARNVSGQVHMYADTVTDSMATAIAETNRRRAKQIAYNAEHGIDPTPLRKKIADITDLIAGEEADTEQLPGEPGNSRWQGRGGRHDQPGPAGSAAWRVASPTARPCPPTSWPGLSRSSRAPCTMRRRNCSSSLRRGIAMVGS